MKTNNIQSLTLLTKDNYLSMIEKSVGSPMFRNLFAIVEGERKDILEDGNISCAYFVSTILYIFKLIHTPHAKVTGLLEDMLLSSWTLTKELQKGVVIRWDEKFFVNSGVVRDHLGFYMGDGIAISNNPVLKAPFKHVYDRYDGRPIKEIYTHPILNG